MDQPHADENKCHIASLPYELRQRIFRFALQEISPLELQTPLWAERKTFTCPLFQVCRPYRDEALEAFYKTNIFFWTIYLEETIHKANGFTHSDPTKYPIAREASGDPLTPTLPWYYPRLMQDLRRLHLKLYLPRNTDVEAWDKFSSNLRALVKALGTDAKLRTLIMVTFIPSGPVRDSGLSHAQKETLSLLGQIGVREPLIVTVRPRVGKVVEDIMALDLPGRGRSS